jgi:hypothetical protein
MFEKDRDCPVRFFSPSPNHPEKPLRKRRTGGAKEAIFLGALSNLI